ncbi:MAG TPA: cysteine desulfurase family protein [Allosphingosinicella sp.]|nr:cysteine desulfurase family protein [Allosphingosinicella sp.]
MARSPRIYLDHAATTPILTAAKAAMVEALERWANPSSPHAEGRAARATLEDARERIKRALRWDGELIFTSGATEAIEIGLLAFAPEEIAVSAVEHDAILRAAAGAERISVSRSGLVDPGNLPDRRLIAVQAANNETGILQPVADGAEAARAQGRLFFCDCAQTAGKLPLPDADLICVASHKLGGPPGVGALLVRDLSLLKARGGQERGYRGGTQNLPAILGLAAALDAREPWLERAGDLRDALEDRLRAAGAEIVGENSPRIPTIGAYRMPSVPSEAQLIHFDLTGIAVSAGSACSSGTMKVSHVLTAMGWGEQAAREVVRVSFGPQTTAAEVDAFAVAWEQLAERKRAA